MELKPIQETLLTPSDIADFILSEPSDIFETALFWKDNFYHYISRLYEQNSILVFIEDKNIKGICGYCFVTYDNQVQINKIKWVLPDTIDRGPILHVGVCRLLPGCSVWALKKVFNTYLNRIEEVTWFNQKFYRRRIHENSMLRVSGSGTV